MKSLLVKETTKQLNGNGAELELNSSEFKNNCEYIVKKEITISTVKTTIDKDVFKTKIGGTLDESYIFSYTTSWKLLGSSVDLSEYGITLEGVVREGDTITVYCDTVNDVVSYAQYEQNFIVYRGASEEVFNYINAFCLNPNIVFMVKFYTGMAEQTLVNETKFKTENFFPQNYPSAIIRVKTLDYYEPEVINIIVAKVI